MTRKKTENKLIAKIEKKLLPFSKQVDEALNIQEPLEKIEELQLIKKIMWSDYSVFSNKFSQLNIEAKENRIKSVSSVFTTLGTFALVKSGLISLSFVVVPALGIPMTAAVVSVVLLERAAKRHSIQNDFAHAMLTELSTKIDGHIEQQMKLVCADKALLSSPEGEAFATRNRVLMNEFAPVAEKKEQKALPAPAPQPRKGDNFIL